MSQKNIEQIRFIFGCIRSNKDNVEKMWDFVFMLQGYLFALHDCSIIDWNLYERIMKAKDKVCEIG